MPFTRANNKTYCIFFMVRGDGGTAYRVPFVGTPFFSLCHSLLSLYLCNVQLDIGQFCNCMSLASPRKNGETLFAFLVSISVRTVSMGQCVRPHVDLTVIDNFSLCSSFCLFFLSNNLVLIYGQIAFRNSETICIFSLHIALKKIKPKSRMMMLVFSKNC